MKPRSYYWNPDTEAAAMMALILHCSDRMLVTDDGKTKLNHAIDHLLRINRDPQVKP